MLLASSSFVFGSYGGGSGDANYPYLIFTPAQLSQIGNNPQDWAKHFKLMVDLDMNDYNGPGSFVAFKPIGYLIWSPYESKPFRGVFDGNKKKISNLRITNNASDFTGLFGYVSGPNSCIKNVVLVNPRINSATGAYVGAVVGNLKTGVIAGCIVDHAVVSGGDCVGGLVGYNTSGAIRNCDVNAVVYGNTDVGGVAGYHAGAFLSACTFSGSIHGLSDVGGLVGESDGNILNCSARGDVVSNEDNIAGLVGTLRGQIDTSFADMRVTGKNAAGGIVGRNTGKIRNCYSSGVVTGNDCVGALTGLLYDVGAISNCFSVADIIGNQSAQYKIIGQGLLPRVSASFCAADESAKNIMLLESTYLKAGWDFVGESQNGIQDLWDMCDGTSLPRLAWQGWPPGDFQCPEGFDINDLVFLIDQWLVTTKGLDADVFNFKDFASVAASWGSVYGQPRFNRACDLWPSIGDGRVDIFDIFEFAQQWMTPVTGSADIAPLGKPDGIVNLLDFAAASQSWTVDN
jgi:hypothetical protein